MKTILLAALLTSLALTSPAVADDTPIGDAVKNLPLFDAHIHYKQPAWEAYPVKSIIELMDRNGVAMGLVSSTPDDGTIKLWEYAPNRIVPELRPYHGDAGSSNWAKSPGMEDYLLGRLTKYPHEGIGEFHIHRIDPADEPLLKKVAAMAKERSIPLHVHSGPEGVRLLYGFEPEVKMIWAHAGLGSPGPEVHATMKEFPNLYADTSLREYNILGFGEALDPDWKKVIFDFQDRLMIGSDTWVNGQWDRYDEIMDSNRKWLALLPKDVAEKIAYKNAEGLFGRKVSKGLIGKR